MSQGNAGSRREKTPERDFGDELGKLRYRTRQGQGMTQEEVGHRIGVSVVTIRNWESGRYRPSMLNLQPLLEVYLAEGAFVEGKEEKEVRDIWERAEMAGLRAALDEEWLRKMLSVRTAPVSTDVSLEPEETRPVEKQTLLPGEDDFPDKALGYHMLTGDSQVSDMFLRLEHASALLIDQNRQHMLRRVYNSWIKGVLKESLYEVAPLALALREESGIVARSAEQEHRRAKPPTDILQVYDEAGGKFVILGASGAGKSTLLLDLAGKLLLRAEYDPAHPIPTVFNLSSWSRQQLPLAEWLVEELVERYQIPRKLGKQWVEDDRLLLLLDGLDEGPAELLPELITAINLYSQEHRVVPLVICTRRNDYLRQPERLHLRKALAVQPLNESQIEEYLQRAGEPLKGVNRILQSDTELRELASSPRMLSLLRLAYTSGSQEELPRTGSREQRRERILALYLRSMLERRHAGYPPYRQQQMQNWLNWLAQQLQRHNGSIFYLEDLQMDWLPDWQKYRFYPPLVMGLVYGLVIGFIKAVDYLLIFTSRQQPHAVLNALVDGVIIGLVTTVVYVILNGLLFRKHLEREEESTVTRMAGNVFYGLLGGLSIGLCIGLLVDVPAGLVNSLFFTLALTILGRLKLKIIPAEVIIWSWSSLRRNLFKFLLGGLGVGLIYGLFTGVPYLGNPFQLMLYLLFGLSIGLIVGLTVGCFAGFSYGLSEKQDKVKPNQGIYNSLRNSLLLAAIAGLASGLAFGLAYWVPAMLIFGAGSTTLFPSNGSLAFGLQDGLAIAAIFWLRAGGTTCIQYILLRILLWNKGCIPWHYTRFLDDASWRTILQKAGGGYIIHQLLLQHMAIPTK